MSLERTGLLKDSKPVYIAHNQRFTFYLDTDLIGDDGGVSIPLLSSFVTVGDNIYIDDGSISFVVEVIDSSGNTICCALNSGMPFAHFKGGSASTKASEFLTPRMSLPWTLLARKLSQILILCETVRLILCLCRACAMQKT